MTKKPGGNLTMNLVLQRKEICLFLNENDKLYVRIRRRTEFVKTVAIDTHVKTFKLFCFYFLKTTINRLMWEVGSKRTKFYIYFFSNFF